jgi:hypothetical protein
MPPMIMPPASLLPRGETHDTSSKINPQQHIPEILVAYVSTIMTS